MHTTGMLAGVSESVVEEAALGWLSQLGDTILHGPASPSAHGEPAAKEKFVEQKL